MTKHIRAPRNKTLLLTQNEASVYREKIVRPRANEALTLSQIINKTVCADLYKLLPYLPVNFADLLILDPPYNQNKDFHGLKFSKTTDDDYYLFLKNWFPQLIKTLKPNGSIYLCGDWKNSYCLYKIINEYAIVRNRITWQREKGRGANANWKNATEDIWFGTVSDDNFFDVEAVKQRRKVIAPYRVDGKPKDWEET